MFSPAGAVDQPGADRLLVRRPTPALDRPLRLTGCQLSRLQILGEGADAVLGAAASGRAAGRLAARRSAVSLATNASPALHVRGAAERDGDAGLVRPRQPGAAGERRRARTVDDDARKSVHLRSTTSILSAGGKFSAPRARNSGMVSEVMSEAKRRRIDPLKVVFALGYVMQGLANPFQGITYQPFTAHLHTLRPRRGRDAAPVREVVPRLELQADHRLPDRRLRPHAHAADRPARAWRRSATC